MINIYGYDLQNKFTRLVVLKPNWKGAYVMPERTTTAAPTAEMLSYAVPGYYDSITDDWLLSPTADPVTIDDQTQRINDILQAREDAGVYSLTATEADAWIDAEMATATDVATMKTAVTSILKKLVPHLLK